MLVLSTFLTQLLVVALLLGACTGGGTAETSGSATLPSTAEAVDPCGLLTEEEAMALLGLEMTATDRPGVCQFASASGADSILIEVIKAPNGADDLADLRRVVEEAIGPVNVEDIDELGVAGYRAVSGSGFQIRFAIRALIVTIGVSLAELATPEVIDRTEEMARVIAARF